MEDDWLDLGAQKTAVQAVQEQVVAAPISRLTAAPIKSLRDAPPSVIHSAEGSSYVHIRGEPHGIESARVRGLWQVPSDPGAPVCEQLLNYLWLSSPHVILVFGTGAGIVGYARVQSIARPTQNGYSSLSMQWLRGPIFSPWEEFSSLREQHNRPTRHALGIISSLSGRVLCRALDRAAFNADPAAYRPELEFLPAPRRRLGRRFPNDTHVKLASCSFDDYIKLTRTTVDLT